MLQVPELRWPSLAAEVLLIKQGPDFSALDPGRAHHLQTTLGSFCTCGFAHKCKDIWCCRSRAWESAPSLIGVCNPKCGDNWARGRCCTGNIDPGSRQGQQGPNLSMMELLHCDSLIWVITLSFQGHFVYLFVYIYIYKDVYVIHKFWRRKAGARELAG